MKSNHESLEAVRALCRVTDEEWSRMLVEAARKGPALSGCQAHGREPMALRGVPSEVPGSIPVATMGNVRLWYCSVCVTTWKERVC
jgi:hypothetical protein